MATATAHTSGWSRMRISPFWIAAIALTLRVGWIIVGHTYKFRTTDNHFSFGWEMGRIGAALASGRGFSDPFGPPTGPTALNALTAAEASKDPHNMTAARKAAKRTSMSSLRFSAPRRLAVLCTTLATLNSSSWGH